MSILSILEEMNEENSIKIHPFSKKDISFRISYATGILFIFNVNNLINEDTEKEMKRVLRSLEIPDDQYNRILENITNPNKELVQYIINLLIKEEEKCQFIVDQYALALKYKQTDEESKKFIQYFFNLLKFSSKEEKLLTDFTVAYVEQKKDAIKKLFQKLAAEKCNIPSIEYFMDDYEGEDPVEDNPLIQIFQYQDREFEQYCKKHPTSYVLNHYGGSDPYYNKIHKISCSTLASYNTAIKKICSEDLDVLEQKAAEVCRTKKGWSYCKRCLKK